MLSLDCFLLSLLLLSVLRGVSCQQLTAVQTQQSTLEGSTLTLTYSYDRDADGTDYFFWYRQYVGKPPEFLISHLGSGEKLKDPVPGLSITVSNKRQIHMQMSSAAVTDSAVYYCAVRNVGQKLVFGAGARLSVEPRTEYQPSYYRVNSGNTAACLATGFSRHNATLEHHGYNVSFSETEPARISSDPALFNQVVFINATDGPEVCEGNLKAAPCDDELRPDLKVNLAAFTTIVLRVIFAKTVIFNILMTLRLWMSQRT